MDAQSFDSLLLETSLLDFSSAPLQSLVRQKRWRNLEGGQRLASIYDFVKNDIVFGYNAAEVIPASQVLSEGYGQCNTKSILLMALLRALGIPCRFHAFMVDKRLQKGALPWLVYALAPGAIGHSWVEAWHANRWIVLEGVILDRAYIEGVRQRFPTHVGSFCGHAIAADDLHNTQETWCGRDTYIQRAAIIRDVGIFDCPDDYFATHPSNVTGVRGWLWHIYFYKIANRIVKQTRASSDSRRF